MGYIHEDKAMLAAAGKTERERESIEREREHRERERASSIERCSFGTITMVAKVFGFWMYVCMYVCM